MTQVFDEAGTVYPVTVVKVGPMTVTQVKNADRDGYVALQIGFGSKTAKNVSKAVKGHLKNMGPFKVLKEFRVPEEAISSYKEGDTIGLDTFSEGDTVDVSAISKAKGFQGVVKRHGFAGGRRSHGQKHSEREAGSIGGAGRAGGRVAKGMRMAGRMGGVRITIKKLKIVQIDPETNQVLVQGAVPGRRGTLVEITKK